MIDDTAIRSALRVKLLSIEGLPTDNDWQGRTFEPVEGVPYMRETLIPNNEIISANKELRAQGIYQIDYTAPINTTGAESKAKDIKQGFQPPQQLMNGQMEIYQAEVLQGREEGIWYRVPVRIYYRVFSTINP